MHSVTSLAAMALMATSALTSPTPQDSTPNIDLVPLRINQVASTPVLLNGPLQVAKTFAKFNPNVTIPATLLAAAQAQQSGTVTAHDQQYDVNYLCPVQIGTPAQTLMMDFDTGSSDLWVYSSKLPNADQTGHSIYQPGKSSTSNLKSGKTWDISYGDGSGASGIVYADTVAIGAVTATSQAVEAATSLSTSFLEDTNQDGLVGLSWPRINDCEPGRCKPFFQNVKTTLPTKVFTADLKKGAAGSYDFGFINGSKYTGDITYAKVQRSTGYWSFTASGWTIANTSTTTSYTAIADTGTTLIYLPDAAVSAYYALIPGASSSDTYGGWSFPCNTSASSLPDFGVNVGGATFTVPGSYFNYAPNGDGTCFGGLQSSDDVGLNILGDMFLKAVFAVFDVKNVRVGFASKKL